MVQSPLSYTSARGPSLAGELPVAPSALVLIAWQVGWPTAIELAANPSAAARLAQPPPRRFVLAPAEDPTWDALEAAGLARRTGLSRGHRVDRELTQPGAQLVRAAVREEASRTAPPRPSR